MALTDQDGQTDGRHGSPSHKGNIMEAKMQCYAGSYPNSQTKHNPEE